jgi:hypothetical protein
MKLKPARRSLRLIAPATAGVAALVASLALAGCSSLGQAANFAGGTGAGATTKMDVSDSGSEQLGSHPVTYQVNNNTSYTLIPYYTGGKATGASTVAPGAAGTITLTDDSSPTDQGVVYYHISEEVDPDDSIDVGDVYVTVTDNWYNGHKVTVDYGPDNPPSLVQATGINTWGSSEVTFFNGSCGTSYSAGAYSIDQTIYNDTPYAMTLVNDVNFTNSNMGSWNTKPPATLAPGACAEINGYTDDLLGMTLNATYTFDTPQGTQWAVFSNGVTTVVPSGGGLSTASAVYSSKPSDTGGGWLGTMSTTFIAQNSDTSPSTSDHPHTTTVVTAQG